MKSTDKPTPLLVCTACGIQQMEGEHLCSKCGAPLTPFAHSDWVLGIQTRGFALQKATTEPKKLIVVVGMWLWLGPMLVIGLGMLFFGLSGVYQAISVAESSILRPAMIVGGISLGISWVAAVILYRTTISYLADRRRQRTKFTDATSEMPEDARGESMTCLACGDAMPAATDRCAKCGWSFELDSNAEGGA